MRLQRPPPTWLPTAVALARIHVGDGEYGLGGNWECCWGKASLVKAASALAAHSHPAGSPGRRVVRDRELSRLERRHPDLAQVLARWCEQNPDASVEDAVRDLKLWHNPKDRDARWLVWRHLPQDAPQKAAPPGAARVVR
jgi:hypothetical protein